MFVGTPVSKSCVAWCIGAYIVGELCGGGVKVRTRMGRGVWGLGERVGGVVWGGGEIGDI